MRAQRVVIFCSEVEVDLDRFRRALDVLLDQQDLTDAELAIVDGPETLADAGWNSVTLTVPEHRDLRPLGDVVDDVAKRVTDALEEDTFAVFVDARTSYARACLQTRHGFPRTADGELFHVIRQASTWLEADPVQLMRYFAPVRNELAAPASDLSAVQVSDEKDVQPELDEDDRFVNAKLKLARELMERYLGGRKER